MGKHTYWYKCDDCGIDFSRTNPKRKGRRVCYRCGQTRVTENMISLQNKRGVPYEKWLEACKQATLAKAAEIVSAK